MKELKVVSLKEALGAIALLCGLTYFLTKKKANKDNLIDQAREYQRGYNDGLAAAAKAQTAQN